MTFRTIIFVLAGLSWFTIACGAASPAADAGADDGGIADAGNRTISMVSISPSSTRLSVGAQQQYTATVSFSDGATIDVTNSPDTAWRSANASVATVTATGLATAVDLGVTTIQATHLGYVGGATITVVR